VDFAWRVHSAQEAWTAKVDGKASILLALEGGLLVAHLAAHTSDGPLGSLRGWRNAAQGASAVLLILAILAAAGAVFPMLGRTKTLREASTTRTIYFGHVRHLSGTQLARHLAAQSTHATLAQLSEQLITMSNLNWRKHRLVQASVLAVLPAAALVALAILWPH
jgi:hypothetical protein